MNDIGIGSRGIVIKKTPAIRRTSTASVHAGQSTWSSDTLAATGRVSSDSPKLEASPASGSRSEAQHRRPARSRAPNSLSITNRKPRNAPSITDNGLDIERDFTKPLDANSPVQKNKDVKTVDRIPTGRQPQAHHNESSKRLTSTGSLQRIQNLYNVENPLDNMRRNSNQLRQGNEQTKNSHSGPSPTNRPASVYSYPQAAIGAIFSRLSGFWGRPPPAPVNSDIRDEDDDSEEEQEDNEHEDEDSSMEEEAASEDQAESDEEAQAHEGGGHSEDDEVATYDGTSADEDDGDADTDEEIATDTLDEDEEDDKEDSGGTGVDNDHTSPAKIGTDPITELASPANSHETSRLTTPTSLRPAPAESLIDDDLRNAQSEHISSRPPSRTPHPLKLTREPRNSLFDLMDRRHVSHRQALDQNTITLENPVPLQPPDYSIYTFGMDADLDNPSALSPFDFSVYRVRMDIDLDNPPPFGPSIPFVSSEAMPEVSPLDIPE